MFMPGKRKSTSLGGKALALSTRFCCLEAKPLAEHQGLEERKSGLGPRWGVCGPADEERYTFLSFYIMMVPQFGFEETTCSQLNTLR